MSWLSNLWHQMHETLTALLHWVEALALSPFGGWSLFGLAFMESSFFPLPPDILLIALCLGEPSKSFLFAGLCALGSVLGGMAGYAIGFYGGRPLLLKMFSGARVSAVERYYDRYNAWAIGIAGLTPLPYKLFTISGGVFAINFRVFVIASIVSRSARFLAVAGLIFWIGEPAKLFIEKYLNLLSIAFVILLVLGFWLVGRHALKASKDEVGEAVER